MNKEDYCSIDEVKKELGVDEETIIQSLIMGDLWCGIYLCEIFEAMNLPGKWDHADYVEHGWDSIQIEPLPYERFRSVKNHNDYVVFRNSNRASIKMNGFWYIGIDDIRRMLIPQPTSVEIAAYWPFKPTYFLPHERANSAFAGRVKLECFVNKKIQLSDILFRKSDVKPIYLEQKKPEPSRLQHLYSERYKLVAVLSRKELMEGTASMDALAKSIANVASGKEKNHNKQKNGRYSCIEGSPTGNTIKARINEALEMVDSATS